MKFGEIVQKTWVLATATALIIGSSSAMAFALSSPNVPTNALNVVAPITAPVAENNQSQASKAEVTANYSVTDQSKSGPEIKDLIKAKLSRIEGITPEQIEEKYNQIIANMTPGEKDISAQQAAAYAAGILKKAYGVDFKGYTAEASFFRSSVPNSDTWSVVFLSPEEIQNKSIDKFDRFKSYSAIVDSVNGTMLYTNFCDPAHTKININLKDPAWTNKAKQAISTFMPENVSISSSKVVSAFSESGVTVVCELSNGSAYAVRLTGENREAADYFYFPNGYDGSLDYKPVTDKAVG